MKKNYTQRFTLDPADNRRLSLLCGAYNEHLKMIENRLGVSIHARGHSFKITGAQEAVVSAADILQQLYAYTANDTTVGSHQVHLLIQSTKHDLHHASAVDTHHQVALHTKHGEIKARSSNQRIYLNNIYSHDINFGIGPAGTGKTYLAVACAVDALLKDKVRRIILARPAVEAGERLGFLPGDLSQKVDPYLRPLYDALYEMLDGPRVTKLLENNIIEIAPLAYMRGRTLSDAFIILDESQNTTVEQMKMFLTRIGFGSKAVITGDITQIDLPHNQQSGLIQVIKVLSKVEGISFTFFDSKDVVRHPLVQSIVDAYQHYQNKHKTE